MEPKLFPEGQCRLILIGRQGNGKSATGNTILGFPAFEIKIGLSSTTQFGDLNSTNYNGLEVQVVDTPGLHDIEFPDDEMLRRITKSFLAISPGPHAFILCLSCELRFTPDEMNLKNNTRLAEFMAQINNRYVLFDNRPELSEDKKRIQVQQLLQYVAAIVRQNGGSCFKHKLSAEMERSMQAMKQAELRKQEQQPGKMPREPKSPLVLARLAEAKAEEEEEDCRVT